MGNAGANGYGLLVDTTGELEIYAPPAAATHTGAFLTSGWHLIAQGGDSVGTPMLGLDGRVLWSGSTAAVGNPSPNQIGWGCDSSSAVARALSLCYPTVYLHGATPAAVQAAFLASTDPTSALALTQGGLATADGLLGLIYTAVHQSFP